MPSHDERDATRVADTSLPPSGEASSPWARERAGGRTRFILRRGVLTWGLPMAILTIVYKVIQEQGFVATPRLTEHLRTAIAIALVVFPLCGWLFGRWLWQTGEENYRAHVRGEDRRD
jgi:hypothetical protein